VGFDCAKTIFFKLKLKLELKLIPGAANYDFIGNFFLKFVAVLSGVILTPEKIIPVLSLMTLWRDSLRCFFMKKSLKVVQMFCIIE